MSLKINSYQRTRKEVKTKIEMRKRIHLI